MSDIVFTPFANAHWAACLSLFDANCPTFFAPNERPDYEAYLDGEHDGYLICEADERIAGAFGFAGNAIMGGHLNWIMIAPGMQGRGIGRAMMEEARRRAMALSIRRVEIAASHLSAPFFARFGARVLGRLEDGWGPGMHRVDMEWVV